MVVSRWQVQRYGMSQSGLIVTLPTASTLFPGRGPKKAGKLGRPGMLAVLAVGNVTIKPRPAAPGIASDLTPQLYRPRPGFDRPTGPIVWKSFPAAVSA